MADFIQTSNTKSAARDLSTPIADISTFDGIIQAVITENPFGCTAYEDGGETLPAVARSREHYTAKIVYETGDAEKVATVSSQAPTVTAFNAAATAIAGDAALASTLGGTARHDSGKDSYYCQLRCHDPSGETYYVTFTRTKVRVSSYEDDAIRTAVETWADTVPALA